MLGLLKTLLEAVGAIGQMALWAIESVFNVVVDAFNATFVAAIALLPELPPEIGPPAYIEYVNWLFPVGAAVTIATGLLAGYVVFLTIRWCLKKAGAM